MYNIPSIIILLLFLAGLVFLQIFLSRRENKWCGLILPLLSFVSLSLLFPLNMARPAAGISAGFVVQMLLVFLLANIPTYILLAIHFACREKLRRRKQLDKMNIQDLD